MRGFDKIQLPFSIHLSFERLYEQYKTRLNNETNPLFKQHLEGLVRCFDENPNLISGITSYDELESMKETIDFIMCDLFPQALSLNEIKAASVPFQQDYIYYSARLRNLLDAAGDNFNLEFIDFTGDQMYIMACNYILGYHYKVQTDYKKPFYYNIPDKNGEIKTYRLAMNADFVHIQPKSEALSITQEDIDVLLQSYDNVDVWKEKFPPGSWDLKGFVLINFIDVTLDSIISDLKSDMLGHSITYDSFDNFQENFKRFFNNQDIQIGFTEYDADTDSFVNPPGKPVSSYVLGDKQELSCKTGLCNMTYKKIIDDKNYLVVSNIDSALEHGENSVLEQLQEYGFKSCIIAPIVIGDVLAGTLEIVSPNKNDLNSINATRLDVIMPYLVATAQRSIQESENYIKAIIQNECTSIHPTVLWKFEEEAKRYIEQSLGDETSEEPMFNDVVFDYVYPLYGQIDIMGSSTVRNDSIQADFIRQLELVKNIFDQAYVIEPLDFYEQIIQRINNFITNFTKDFNTTSEEQLLYFLRDEVNPIMPHIEQLSDNLKQVVLDYNNLINEDSGIIYDKRRDYEHAVQNINQNLAALIDKKQEEAQVIFPHFFERFKTDGVEHNMYIGASLVKHKPFNTVYLKNLRLWQLITMCEMERYFYDIQDEQSIQLSCASLALVFSNSLSVRYRIDEKKFDVDGAYNARYEIIKKRIDKAHIKNTSERITQKGKLVIVYSQKKDELEYLRYLNFLREKEYISGEPELVELEDLQGVVGLKAIRVNINYNTSDSNITYNDLIKELSN